MLIRCSLNDINLLTEYLGDILERMKNHPLFIEEAFNLEKTDELPEEICNSQDGMLLGDEHVITQTAIEAQACIDLLNKIVRSDHL